MNVDGFNGWVEPSEVRAPEPGEIHIWRISLAGQSGAESWLKEFLSPEEIAQASRFHFAQDQRRFIIRRAVLRQLLATCLKTTPPAVQIKLGTHGKPFVPGQTNAAGFHFNCSHSADWALIAVARGIELGVDLEQHRPMTDAEDLAKNYFSAAEISELAGLPPTLKVAGFFNGWTRKEAFIKATGLGLSFPLNRFAVSLSPEKPAALLPVAGGAGALKKWALVSFDAAPDFSAALVFEGKSAAVKFFDRSSLPPK
jgi:4'-phosphopantetheinyl transferase